tara:strand:+ start:1283 stop:2323 length:1041 start_codon:yes stop_codon:yes gene_type:complete
MAIKITTSKAKTVDIVARKGDDFLIQLEIKDEQGNLVPFNKDEYTYVAYEPTELQDGGTQHLNEENDIFSIYSKRDWLGKEDTMLFTITTEDGNPVLAACSSDLDLAMNNRVNDPTVKVLDGVAQNGKYQYPTNQRDFDKHYGRFHIYKLKAVANILADSSNRNTEEERSNYYLDKFHFTHNSMYSRSDLLKPHLSVDRNWWLYNVFTNTDVIKNSNYEQMMKEESDSWQGLYEDNRYIFWGQVEGTPFSSNYSGGGSPITGEQELVNNFTIKFSHDKFNLPKGTYWYTFKSLSGFTLTALAGEIINVPHTTVSTTTHTTFKAQEDHNQKYSNVTTWIRGKLKVTD